MKRGHVLFALAALLAAGLAAAQTAPTPGSKGTRRALTLRGEVLDMSCYTARGASGPIHRECALQCIASGVCMGMLGPDSMLYMLTVDHARAMAPSTFTTPDPFVQCKSWAALNVEIAGVAYERRGMHIIEVSRAKLLPAPTSP